ncbi:beta family protein [Streptomyces buecherae]|uniref:beta family protein n=1 Tax=Streptomyces buecherae TaxID=2763006 RepID=UPI001C2769DE|nr:beta family protein [Streptomyces buecherae]
MPEPLYVPVLPTRPHASTAYRRLLPPIQRGVTPLWTVPQRTGLPLAELGKAFRADLDVVTRAQRYQPAWLDAPFVDETQFPVLAPLLRRVAAVAPLRPVTGPSRPGPQQRWAWEAARRSGDGLGIRVTLPQEWDAETLRHVRDLLAQADPAVRVDLLLDLVTVLPDRPDAGKEALRALDALLPLAPWRTLALIAGGAPQPAADLMSEGMRDEPRTDWALWGETLDSGRSYLDTLAYGDYGVQPASALSRDPQPGKGGPPWGTLRYTTDRSYLLAKMFTRGDERTAHNRAMARRLLATPGFRATGTSTAEAWIRDCAQGSGGTGNASTWLWVGNVQHMTYVVHSLRSGNPP